MKTIQLDKGTATIYENCVNSNWKARFFCKEDEECCQCSFGQCKVKVEIEYNGHGVSDYILTESEINNLPKQELDPVVINELTEKN